MGARRRARPKLPRRRRANLEVGEDCSASPQRLCLAISGQAMNADAFSST
jgi:hypothetical protein